MRPAAIARGARGGAAEGFGGGEVGRRKGGRMVARGDHGEVWIFQDCFLQKGAMHSGLADHEFKGEPSFQSELDPVG